MEREAWTSARRLLLHDSVQAHQMLSNSVQRKKSTVGLVHMYYSLDILPIAFAIM